MLWTHMKWMRGVVLCEPGERRDELLKIGLWEKQWRKWKTIRYWTGNFLWKVLWILWITLIYREKQCNYENCTGVAAKKIRLRFFEKTEKVEHFFPEIQVRRTESVRLLWTNWRRVARSFLYLRYVKAWDSGEKFILAFWAVCGIINKRYLFAHRVALPILAQSDLLLWLSW